MLPGARRWAVGRLSRSAAAIVPGGRVRERVERLSGVLAAANSGQFYQSFVSYWKNLDQVIIDAEPPGTVFDQASPDPFFDRMTLLDTMTYLPGDILVKVDRAAMAVGLETRVPMIDHRVFEFARGLPWRYKVRDGQGKDLLRQLLYRHVPAHMVDRPKKGFSVPLARWLRGPLKDWGAALLDPASLRGEGIFHAAPVLRKWEEHQAGSRDWSPHLWSVLLVQAWLDTAGKPARPEEH